MEPSRRQNAANARLSEIQNGIRIRMRGSTHEAAAAPELSHEMQAHHVNARLEAAVQLAQIVERYYENSI